MGFVPDDNPTAHQREAWIQSIADFPRLLRRTVSHLNEEQLNTPYRPGGWTIRQVVHHMADNDMNAYIRFKRGLTEESPLAGSYEQDLWAGQADYRNAPIELSLVLLEALHQRFAVLLRSLSPEDFQRTLTSPSHGVMTLDIALQRYDWHGKHHLDQIRSLLERMGWQLKAW